MEEATGRRPSLTPARLLIGSLVVGTGLTVLGFLFGGGQASAAEPAPPGAPSAGIGSLVSGVAQGAAKALDATAHAATSTVEKAAAPVVQAVAPAVPQPVQQAVAPVVQPVTQTVDDIAAQKPVTSVVQPVATAVDEIVAATPVVRDVVGTSPVNSTTAPITEAVDSTLGDVVGVAETATTPVSDPPAPSVPPSSGPADGSQAASATERPAVLALSAPAAPSSRIQLGSTYAAPALAGPSTSVGSTTEPWLLVDPAGAPDGNAPPGAPSGASSGGLSLSSGAAPAAAAAAFGFTLPSAALSGLHGLPGDDRIPAAPVADHDISPD